MSRISQIALSSVLPLFVVTATNAATIFEQTFSSADTTPGTGVTSIYTSATPNSGQFDDISADGTNNKVAIVNDDLVFDMNDNGSADISGFLRATDLATPAPTVLAIETVFTYTNNGALNSGPGPTLQVGNYANSAGSKNYHSGGSGDDRFDDLIWRRNGSTFQLELNDTDPVAPNNQGVVRGLAYGEQHSLLYLLNNSGSAQNYIGPDGISRVLNSGSSTLFVNNVLGVDNSLADDNGNININLSSLRFRAQDLDSTIAIDSIRVSDTLPIPEPSSALVLLGAGGLLAMRRRNRA